MNRHAELAGSSRYHDSPTLHEFHGRKGSFFIFYFYFLFLQKYIFDLKIYRNIPRPPRCRAAGTWQRGGRGISEKNFTEKITRRSLGAGRPAAGRPAQGDRISHPYIRVGWSPHPSFASLKFQKPRKKKQGGREAKPCRIFEPATAGNQNSSTLY